MNPIVESAQFIDNVEERSLDGVAQQKILVLTSTDQQANADQLKYWISMLGYEFAPVPVYFAEVCRKNNLCAFAYWSMKNATEDKETVAERVSKHLVTHA